jgi:Ca2+-binding RTX toxin-like protein
MSKKLNLNNRYGSSFDDDRNDSNGNHDFFGFGDFSPAFGWPRFQLGGPCDDLLVGTPKNDVIFAGRGDDALLGTGGNDILIAGPGNDLLVGGAGNDHLSGGSGINTFLFRTGFGNDTITDFSSHDILNFNGLGFASAAAAKSAMV